MVLVPKPSRDTEAPRAILKQATHGVRFSAGEKI
tara:strand:+ start:411 stop:512 length:102 start_codon:yes stop_codon:yes gene_type:complete